MLKSRCRVAACSFAAAAFLAVPASAQIYNNGPPIPPEQVLRQQSTSPPPPPPPLQGPPPISAPFAGYGPVANPRIDPNAGGRDRDRVAQCQHEATVERVPRSKRAAYIHNCSIGN
jgi:hypothetical protein